MNRSDYLRSTPFLDFESETIKSYLEGVTLVPNEREMAIILYEKVRDDFLYDPYHLDLRESAMKASVVVNKKRAWCVEKAVLLAACLRSVGIPSRLGFAIVTNHIGVERLVKYLRKEEIVFHGYVEVFLSEKWVKCTPAFDQRVCRLSGVDVLEWDGVHDSMFQAYDRKNQRFMEYKHFYGEFEDLPIRLMHQEMKKHYPHLFEGAWNQKEFSFFHSSQLTD
ncbi:MAG: transglutaminase family protein [Bacteroidetes bacterium]|nr:MAG: transglutaminase family protein [Bacteroidota bacterium]